VLTAVLLIVLVAISRVYLGAHYLSDVVAAVIEGLLWLALSLVAVDITQWRRATPPEPARPGAN
jgi:undecaprenyl-diphosphatase